MGFLVTLTVFLTLLCLWDAEKCQYATMHSEKVCSRAEGRAALQFALLTDAEAEAERFKVSSIWTGISVHFLLTYYHPVHNDPCDIMHDMTRKIKSHFVL
jgi:hypothetical protein